MKCCHGDLLGCALINRELIRQFKNSSSHNLHQKLQSSFVQEEQLSLEYFLAYLLSDSMFLTVCVLQCDAHQQRLSGSKWRNLQTHEGVLCFCCI